MADALLLAHTDTLHGTLSGLPPIHPLTDSPKAYFRISHASWESKE